MTTDKTPNETPQQPCVPGSPSQFELLLKAYGITLADEKQRATADLSLQNTKTETADYALCIERKVNDKYARAVKEYNFLSNCITVYSSQDLDGLTDTVGKVIGQKNKDVKTSLDAAVAAIKAAKGKIGLMDDLAVQLKDAVADSCNSEELKQIRECLAKGGAGKKNIEDSVAEFVTYADQIVDQVDDVAQAAVKVSGINAFINIDSLIALVATAKADGGKLATDVEANVKDSQKKYDDSRKPLGDALKGLSTASTEKYKAANYEDAVIAVSGFVEHVECHDCRSLDEIAEEAEDTFNSEHCGSCGQHDDEVEE
ncbi:MAG TPA: hypothetical protein VM802_07870 [Chitinophaga sp.]|uniref:hypothetical protein n=1 Tax=Chitinophaga sp. TaxID=1869181 RepID=UPI002D1D9895|nr:hypothetical protein [Chitinophaga sp.]HVI44771.1 hypothetical protein [Chitinophaga sp.]